MRTYRDVEQFAWDATTPTPAGYQVTITCSCGVVFDRHVLPLEAEEDLLRSALWPSEN